MNKIILISTFVLLSPVTAYANGGTCASPVPLASLSSDSAGDTCGGEAGINMGGTVYGHPSRVYSFHVNHAV